MTVSIFSTRLLLAAGPLLAMGLAQAGPMQDIGTSSGPQCAGRGVNNSGYTVGICAEANGSTSGFVALAAGSAVDLAHLMPLRNCSAGAVTTSGRVIGSCLNGNSLPTAVVWNATAPTAVQALQPSLGTRSRATAYNQAGVVAGVNVLADNTVQPVMWASNQTAAQTLPAGVLGLNNGNCVPADVDSTAANPAKPPIVGNCPGINGRPQPLLWSVKLLGAYGTDLLTLPDGANHCVASHISNSRILGTCDMGDQGSTVAVWTNPGLPPLTPAIAQRSHGVDINANGGVVGHYMSAAGYSVPFYWDTTTNAATSILALTSGFNISVTAIGDNGTVVGNSETPAGTTHAIRWTLAGGTVDLGTLGGDNSSAASLSQDGCYLTGVSEVGAQKASHAFVQNLCVP